MCKYLFTLFSHPCPSALHPGHRRFRHRGPDRVHVGYLHGGHDALHGGGGGIRPRPGLTSGPCRGVGRCPRLPPPRRYPGEA